MRKALRFTVIGLIVLIMGAVGLTTVYFHTFRPGAISDPVVSANLDYFQQSFPDCRRSFLDEAEKLRTEHETMELSAIDIDSRQDTDLTVDYCYIPARQSFERLLILTSGVHGVEGYAGSAVQQMVLREMIPDLNLDKMGVLLIHGVNPYGFKFNRRVTENNVDLNRNCSLDPALYQTQNKGYARLNPFLNKKHKVRLTHFDQFFFQISAIRKILQHSMDSLRQAVLQGQYQFEKGVYFGGRSLEPSVKALIPVIQRVAQPYGTVFAVDLHTGYGRNGRLHLFPNPIEDPVKKAELAGLFPGMSIDWGNTDGFYVVTGEFTSFVGQLLNDKEYLAMTFEFGTMDTQRIMGAIKALHHVLTENQGFHYGYRTLEDEDRVRSDFLDGYYPASQAWRSKTIEDSRRVLTTALERFQALSVKETH